MKLGEGTDLGFRSPEGGHARVIQGESPVENPAVLATNLDGKLRLSPRGLAFLLFGRERVTPEPPCSWNGGES